jgi:hypothetical protein
MDNSNLTQIEYKIEKLGELHDKLASNVTQLIELCQKLTDIVSEQHKQMGLLHEMIKLSRGVKPPVE